MNHQPVARDNFEIAIVTSLPLEYNAASYIFDEFWDGFANTVEGDSNYYTHGRIGKYNVVLILLPGIGKVHAASSTATLNMSYRNLRLAFLIGICGGVPFTHKQTNGVLLGDVIIGSSIVQFDLGREYPTRFLRKDSSLDNMGRLSKDLRTTLRFFETDRGLAQLREKVAIYLGHIQRAHSMRCQGRSCERYNYPGTSEDKLFEATYHHRHRGSGTCCSETSTCELAYLASCKDVGCDESHLLPRKLLDVKRTMEEQNPKEAGIPTIHIGPIASGDTVMRCGEARDRIARIEEILAFEMEAAGVWGEIPSLVVKGVSDYADSHKQKRWQDYAAATAAATLRALLGLVQLHGKSQISWSILPKCYLLK
ncbi:pfs domain-containing protein [Metarhizium guizhouense ARSEF 977]|uniref:Pfs domain-containing protein n=1 Tax=Metarhizium guizhouense (strain ARSEF 977) TaxID=1276136 RepID=A0A0B4HZC2_METGA|nr:pfs domain-containing protein [Metarhizium guizhouense ARSEF 977]